MYTFCIDLSIRVLDNYRVAITTPWLEIFCTIEPSVYNYLKQHSEKNLIKGEILQEKRFLPFLKHFLSYPICVVNPRQNLDSTSQDTYHEKLSKDELTNYQNTRLQYPDYCLTQVDIEKVITFCKISSTTKTLDPLSVVSYLRILAHRINSNYKKN